jgi:hypothetical protein
MTEFFTSLLKNLSCSQCQDFDINDSDNMKDWNLYLKQYEMYTAMILYNHKLKKDISKIISKNESIILLDENNNVYIKLEFISNNEEDQNRAILVPTDEYQELYQNIEKMDKKLDETMKAYLIGKFNIQKVK